MQNNSLPSIPWRERPAGKSNVVWRYDDPRVHEILDLVKTNPEK